MRKFLPYGCQHITQADVKAVSETLMSAFLTQGPQIEKFESAFCRYTRARFAVSCTSGTAALHLAALAADLKKGDRAVVPAITFVASANGPGYTGASILFADINPNNMTICCNSLTGVLKKARAKGAPVKLVVSVDMAGHPCDMEKIAALKAEYGFIWVQDACHSAGALWRQKSGASHKVGDGYGPDMTVFSFHPVKHITTGEGGMITTNSALFADRLKLFRVHGIRRDVDKFMDKSLAFDADGLQNPWYYEMDEPGYNYRMTDFQAALGLSQLSRLDEYVARRGQIAARYREKLASSAYVSFPDTAVDVAHAWHLVVVFIDFAAARKSRAKVMNELKSAQIGTQVHYIPVPMLHYYAQGNDMSYFPNAAAYYEKALSLPCFPGMSDKDVDYVVAKLTEVLG